VKSPEASRNLSYESPSEKVTVLDPESYRCQPRAIECSIIITWESFPNSSTVCRICGKRNTTKGKNARNSTNDSWYENHIFEKSMKNFGEPDKFSIRSRSRTLRSRFRVFDEVRSLSLTSRGLGSYGVDSITVVKCSFFLCARYA